ncbi:MAG: response regulator transcription factor [Acidimicrobiales bacterium]|nr:response regulator transcription factor [Acidimicrobiales bacterium]
MLAKNRILIAEDDEGVRGAIRRALEYEGYQVMVAEDGASALEISENMTPDLYLLDVMMPKLDGLSVCRTLRRRGDATPILVVTARHLVSDRVAGLDAGADDYLVKPFALDELLARVRALLRRRTIGKSGGILETAGIRLDQDAREVSRNEVSVQLTKTEFDLLELLMFNAGVVLARETIYDLIWDYRFETNSKSLDVYIGYLRRKITVDDMPDPIHTVRGVGYCLRET